MRELRRCDERLVAGSPGLKDGFQFEGPGIVDALPFRMGFDSGADFREIRRVIGAKIEASSLRRPLMHPIEKKGLKQAVFVVSPFRPRIWEEDEYGRKSDRRWQSPKEIVRIGVHEMEMVEFSAVAFPNRADDALSGDINANAGRLGVGCGIARQKMPVSAADLPHEALLCR